MAVKVTLPTIIDRIKKMQKFTDKILMPVAEVVRGEIVKNWLKTKGADGKPFKPLNPTYLQKKVKMGRLGLRNLHLSAGSPMATSLSPRKSGKSVIVGWTEKEQLDKARGNHKHAKGMMSIGPVIESKANQTAFKLWTK